MLKKLNSSEEHYLLQTLHSQQNLVAFNYNKDKHKFFKGFKSLK